VVAACDWADRPECFDALTFTDSASFSDPDSLASSLEEERLLLFAVALWDTCLWLAVAWCWEKKFATAEITRKRIRRGVFKSVDELESAIMEYLENHNADPKPFIWTKSAGEILEKVARAKQAVESQH
jgi:hypothetical protein